MTKCELINIEMYASCSIDWQLPIFQVKPETPAA